MKRVVKKAISFTASLVMLAGLIAPAAQVEAAASDISAIENAAGRYSGDEGAGDTTPFVKLSHPENPASKMDHPPTKSEEDKKLHQEEVFADGLVDYLGEGKLGAPGYDEGANGQGDRAQTYSWTGISYGDWMYVSTQYNSAGATGDLMGKPVDKDNLEELYGGDYYAGEDDGGVPGSTLSKINVKTGEVQILMSASKNGLDAQFRSSIEFNGKLYFCGSVNHLPSIYEVDPKTDALQCVYQDPSMKNHPGGVGAAWQEARNKKKICPAIRGLTTFGDYLIISCVGLDENPYIAVSKDPSSGQFTKIASAWKNIQTDENGLFKTADKAELFGYPACHIPDSIFGGSIWEMVTFNGDLYVAMCTGTPATAETHDPVDENGEPKVDENGNPLPPVIDTMQSFALVKGECTGEVDNPADWTWTAIAGDPEDGAPHPFGLDPERHRAGACNMVVYGDHLYIGEYNDTQIAFQNMTDQEFTFLKKNMEESVSIYRMDANENFEKVMGSSTEKFPNTVSGNHTDSGFGHKETQYIWQTKVFNGKLYAGTFDESMILYPLVKQAEGHMGGQTAAVSAGVDAVTEEAMASVDIQADAALLTAEAVETVDANAELYKNLVEIYNDFEAKKEITTFADSLEIPEDSNVLLPASIVDAEPLVKVNTVEDMYLALLTVEELLQSDNTGYSFNERTAELMQILKLREEVMNFQSTTTEEMPAVMTAAADTLAGEQSGAGGGMNDDIMYIMMNLKEAVRGFDMYSTDDGINFKQITRSGLGDPYNQGLRVFAANTTEENPWLCIGSANPFYGTQVWRMNADNLKKEAIDAPQIRTLVNFVDEEGNEVKCDRDKAPEIYVNEGVTEVHPKDIPTIFPMDYQLVEPDKAVPVEDIEGSVKKSVTFVMHADNKTVEVTFMDGETSVGGYRASVGKSHTKLTAKDIQNNLPKGYELVDPKAKYDITEKVDGGFAAEVPVKKSAEQPVEKFTVSFNANGGTGEMAAVTDVSGEYTVPVSTFTAPEGKQFKNWAVDSTDGEAVQAEAVYNVTKDVTFFAVWEDAAVPETEYAITVADTKNGEVKVSAEKAVKGTEITITAAAAENYEVDTVKAAGTEDIEVTKNADGTYTFVMPQEDVTVTVTFKEILTHTITVKQPENGTISVDKKTAAKGTEVTVTAAAKENYEVFKVIVKGSKNLPVTDNTDGTYTFVMPDEDVTVTADIQAVPVDTYKVDVQAREHGSAKVTHTKAEEGTEVTVTPKADKGYKVDTVVVTGSAQIAVTDNENGTYSFIMPAENVTVEVTFTEGEKIGKWMFDGTGWWYEYEDGTYAAGFKTIDGQRYYFKSNGYMVTGWQFINGDWYYFNGSGYMVKGWSYIADNWYYFDANGIMQTGITPDGYICNSSGAMVKNGWLVHNSKWYYGDENGRPVRNTWKWIANECYYFYEDGHMASSEMIGSSYVNASGCWVPDRWVNDSNGWWYRYGSGKYPYNTFETIGGQTYYFGSNGYMVTGWKVINGNWYYFNGSGYMAKSGWAFIDGNWYYFDNDGVMARSTIAKGYLVNGSGAMVTNTWVYIDGNWYYADAYGVPAKDWAVVSGQWYYFDPETGIMQTGMAPDGSLLSSSGALAKNEWVVIDGEWYYANGSGKAIKNEKRTISGYEYYFHEDGRMAKDEYVDGNYYDKNGHHVPEKDSKNIVKTAVYNLAH